MQPDKYGLDYEATVAIQHDHLTRWKNVLRPDIFAEIHLYVIAVNEAAIDQHSRHRVYRGSELANIIFDWPNLKPCYAPRPKGGDEFV